MAALYPTTLKSFMVHTDLTDDVMAQAVNDLQDEVTAIETVLGTNPHRTTALSGGVPSGTTLTNVGARIGNIESGKAEASHISGSLGAMNVSTVWDGTPATGQQYLFQAGIVRGLSTDYSGYLAYNFPKPFPHGLVGVWPRSNSYYIYGYYTALVGADDTPAPTRNGFAMYFWLINNLTGPRFGGIVANLQIGFSYFAIGF